MNTIDKIIIWVKANILLALGILVAVTVVLFPKALKGLFRKPRVRHRRSSYAAPRRSRSKRRSLPRSVGMHKARKQYTKGGKLKKPWQIKGSIAARRHMARIRKMR